MKGGREAREPLTASRVAVFNPSRVNHLDRTIPQRTYRRLVLRASRLLSTSREIGIGNVEGFRGFGHDEARREGNEHVRLLLGGPKYVAT